jgi:cell division protein FtsX
VVLEAKGKSDVVIAEGKLGANCVALTSLVDLVLPKKKRRFAPSLPPLFVFWLVGWLVGYAGWLIGRFGVMTSYDEVAFFL